MRVCATVQMLAVLAALVLTTSVCDGLQMGKCELRDKLEQASMPLNPLDPNELAKLVCHAEKTSGFETDAIKQIAPSSYRNPKAKNNKGRKTRDIITTIFPKMLPTSTAAAEKTTPPVLEPGAQRNLKPDPKLLPVLDSSKTAAAKSQLTTQSAIRMKAMPISDTQVPLTMETNPGSVTSNPLREIPLSSVSNDSSPLPRLFPQLSTKGKPRRARGAADPKCTLYGIFQLSSCVACVSPQTPSLNLCELPCESLIDDDVTDDIACVAKIIDSMKNKGEPGEPYGKIKKMYDLLHQEECAESTDAQYFAEC